MQNCTEKCNNWLENEKNRNLYYEWLAEWESEFPQYVPDVENKLDEYLSKIQNDKKDIFLFRY